MKYLPFFLLLAVITLIWSCKAKPASEANYTPLNLSDMDKVWKKIDSLESKGLISSALEEVQKVKQSALAGKESGHLIKAVVYENKYLIQLEEDSALKALQRAEQELPVYPEPAKSVMHSLTAQWYTNYMRGHLWELRNRTEFEGPAGPDIRTWGVRHFVDKIHEHYSLSVQWPGLKVAEVKSYEILLTEDKKTDDLRPTLYDILMHRALDFFSSNESWLTRPSYDFVLTDSMAMAPASDFVSHTFKVQDSLSSTWITLKWFQDLLAFRLSDTQHPSAFLDADLKRLKYAQGILIHDQKDALYQNELKKLSTRYAGNPESTLVDFYRAEWLVNKAAEWHIEHDSTYRYAYNEALMICQQAISDFPDAYGAQMCKSLIQQIEAKSLSVSLESTSLPNEELLAKVDYRNLNGVYFTLVKLPSSPRRWKGDNWDGEEILKRLNQLPVIKEWKQDLNTGNDHQPHGTETGIPALPVGHYALIASDQLNAGEQKATAGTIMFTVSSLAYWYLDDRGTGQRAAIVNRASGMPMAGVKVEFISQQYNASIRRQEEVKLGEAVSDATGWVSVPAQPNKNITLRLTKGDDELFPDDAYYTYNNARSSSPNPTALFFSDRAIYRPGQKIYFKGYALVFDKDRIPEIVEDKKVEIILYDVNGQEVAKQSLQTNSYGTFFGHFDLPTGGLTGQMSISSNHGPGRHYFSVEEYKRPKFEVSFDTLRESVRLDQEVVVRALAIDYAGSAVSGAQVSYRVERVAYRPWWWYWRGGSRPGQEDRQVMTTGAGLTNADGSISIPFVAKSKPGGAQDLSYRFEVTAYVTDITGETHEATKSLMLNHQGYVVQISLPDRVVLDKLKEVEVIATNSDGSNVSVNGEVEISQITGPSQNKRERLWEIPDLMSISDQDYLTRFPHYMLPGKEHMSEWPIQQVTGKRNVEINGEGKVDISSLINSPGYYKLIWNWKDASGKLLTITQYIMAYATALPLPGHEVSQVVFDDKPYEPKERVSFSLLSGLTVPPSTIRLVEYRTRENVYALSSRTSLSSQAVEITEQDRGGIYVYHLTAFNNRFYKEQQFVRVPWSNKALNVSLKTWRDKIEPGDEETWTMTVEGSKQEKIAAEMVLSMYDASLDAFVPHQWSMNLYPVTNARAIIHSTSPLAANYWGLTYHWDQTYHDTPYRQYRDINLYGYYPESGYYMRSTQAGRGNRRGEAPVMMQVEDSMMAPPGGKEGETAEAKSSTLPAEDEAQSTVPNPPQLRSALDETVFFYPQMNTDDQGRLTFSFKMKEGLTRWKFQALAHTPSLAYGYMQEEVVTQKKLMVFPNPPRFFREGDTIAFQAKVTSLSDELLSGNATLKIVDAFSNEDVSSQWGITVMNKAFQLTQRGSTPVSWMLNVPENWYRPVKYQVSATAGAFADGEESLLPVVTNRILVTETLPLPVKANETRTFVFSSMLENKSSSLSHHQYVVEMTTSPAWYAVQALPYLMEYPHECAEQIFSRIYANTLAAHITLKNPEIRRVYDAWRMTESDALLSNLEKNQDLKSALLDETPWVRDAMGETRQKKDIGLLFETNRLNQEKKQALTALQTMQMANGGFPWFPGGKDNWYITQYILEGFGHLDKMNVSMQDPVTADIIRRAIPYIDSRMIEWYDELKRLEAKGKLEMDDHQISALQVHYLYTRSFFPEQQHPAKIDEIKKYLLSQFEKYWLKHALYDQGLIALGTFRAWPENNLSKEILSSLQERTIYHEELGRYWKFNAGFHWNESGVELQSLMIELFQDMDVPQHEVDELRVWLLKQKQTTRWKSTKATAAAIYALLIHPDTWLQSVGTVTVKLDGKEVIGQSSPTEAGTGYIRQSWDGTAIKDGWSSITVSNPNSHIAWGSAYWQYWEDIDQVKSAVENNPLKVSRTLLKVSTTDRGEASAPATYDELKIGDKLIVRLTIETDRAMEYVHLKDLRASGFEPMDVLSGYRWNGGIGMYQSTRDLATHFFIDYLPRGKHVIEYTITVAQAGHYSEGLATLQCMYAPEFGSHSQGSRVQVTSN